MKTTLAITKSRLLGLLAAGLATAATGQEAVTATNTPAKPLWDTSAHVGLTLTRGNSRTLLAAGDIASTRKWDKNEILLGADAIYGENKDVETGENEKSAEIVHAYGQYNRLFTERFFGYARAEGLHDGIADVEYRVSLSPGVGYYFIKRPRTVLNCQFGPGYVFEKLGDDTRDYATLRFAERFDQTINERAKFWQSLEFVPQVDDFENYVASLEIGIETAITKNFTQRVSILDTYRNQPAPGRMHNDIKLIAAIGYKF